MALAEAADDDGDDEAIVERILGALPERGPPAPLPTIAGLENMVEVGRGGMGVVYRAHDARLGRTVAVKVLAGTAALSAEGRTRAEREARLLARVHHPNVVRVHAVVEAGGVPAIVMEWIDGPSLADRSRIGMPPLRDVLLLVRDLARAVEAVHAAGIIHRDIKPANVLLAGLPAEAGSTDSRPVAKLVDFGLARPEIDTTHAVTRPSVTVGTPSFMAPEQTGLDPALGPVGPATDIHGLGTILYWLLSGRAPYDGATTAAALKLAADGDAPRLSLLVPRLPADVGTIVATCLARHPERRYPSAAALADDLTRFLDGRPILARRAGPVERVLKWARRRPVVAAIVASAAVAAMASAAGVFHHLRSLERARGALEVKRDEAIAAAALARESFERLTDSSAERFLARGGALDAADRDHLREIRERYRVWPLEPDAAAALHFRAAGLFRLTSLFGSLRWQEDALETAQHYGECLRELVRRGLATPEEISQGYRLRRVRRGILAGSGRVEEAIAEARAAIAEFEAGTGADPALERHLAASRADLGNMLGKAGECEEARALQEQAVAQFDRLVAASPDDADLARLSLTVVYNAAINAAFADDPPARRALLQTLVDRSAWGLERFTDDPTEFGRGLVLALGILAQADLEEGRAEEALAKVRRRAAVARQLAEGSPHRQRFLDEAIGAATQAFHCHKALGRPDDAEPELDEADALASRALAEEPAVHQRTWVLADVLATKADMLESIGKIPESLAVRRRLLEVLLPWEPEDGSAPPFPVTVAGERAEIERLEAKLRAPSAPGAPPPRDDASAGPVGPVEAR